ncbi:MAG: aldehyde dehydrogenase family protein [Minwuiales bacterium]|nr:aldehyde dehydrogenase family protein [Minwuiales bacterium]
MEPQDGTDLEVIDPSTEEAYAVISLGGQADTDAAVAAANAAFDSWSQTPKEERVALLEKLLEIYGARMEEMGETISREMGAPLSLAKSAQAGAGFAHIKNFIRTLKGFEFDRPLGEHAPNDRILYEAIGVCGLITPWNWPMNQVTLKVIPAIAAGCTMVLKPSEIAPMSSLLFAEMVHEAGFPAGVFNLVNGDGAGVGTQLSGHPDVDMISFTGSTRAGKAISKNAADTIKRVHLELGGKGANIIFADADEKAVKRGTMHCFNNTGQSCNAPTRMLVERAAYDKAVEAAAEAAAITQVDDPAKEGRHIGPVVSQTQFDKVQTLIDAGIKEGARLVAGGLGRPEGTNRGYFVRPTVFADVNNDMTIAREEIFGPVLSILGYKDEDDAVRIANDTLYGLSGYVSSSDLDHARAVARRIRAGNVHLNGANVDFGGSFGGYKQSGNGREWGLHGFEEFLEVKSVFGYDAG